MRRLAAVVWLAWLAGCGGDAAGPRRPPVHPVAGRVLVGGAPAAGVHLGFVPLAGGVVRPVAVSGPDGTFRLTTHAAGDGAPAGDYAVTAFWPDPSIPADDCGDPTAHDRLHGFYLDAAPRRLLATVDPGPTSITLHIPLGGGGWTLPRQHPTGKN